MSAQPTIEHDTNAEDRRDACPALKEPARLRRQIHPAIEPIEGTAPLIDFVASDQTLDRYDEVIVASGWRLENYRKNPIIQNAHQYGDILFTIGRAVVTEVRGNHLYQRVEFATDVNPMARIAYGLYKGRFLNAVSVGFMPLRWEMGGPDAGFHRKFIEQELLEVSAVAIPANPNALQLALRDGAIERSDLRELAELLDSFKHFRNDNADTETTLSAQGPEVHAAHWLHLQTLLRQIRGILRRS